MARENDGTRLDYLDHVPTAPARRAIVWLHGLGADGHDFEMLFRPGSGLPEATRVLLPHAPARPVTINGGLTMRAWYDIASSDLAADPDLPGIRASAERIAALLGDMEAAGILPERIVLGGFSQGGVLALWAGLGYPRALAGIAALSAYLPADPPVAAAQRETPLFLAHGRWDSLIPFGLGEAARDRLPALGAAVPEWHPYPLDHGVSDAEVADLRAWLGRVLA